MKCSIFLGYEPYNDENLDLTNYYTSSDDYIKMLEKYGSAGSEMAKFDYKNNEMKYAKCECTILDGNNNDLSIDGFKYFFNKEQMSMFVLDFDFDTEEEEFDTEFNSWVEEHNQLSHSREKLTDYELFSLEPKRDLKVSFIDNSGEEINCKLLNVRIVDKVSPTKFVVLTDKVDYVKPMYLNNKTIDNLFKNGKK